MPDDGHGLDADHPVEIPARGWRDVAVRVKDEMKDDHASLSSAGVAFFGFLALIPGLAALVSLYGIFADPDDVRARVESLTATLPTEARDLIEDQLTRLTGTSTASLGLGLVVSVALALWSASSGVAHIVEAINIAYDEKDERGPVARRGMALLMTLALVVVAGVAIAVTALLSQADDSSMALRWVLRLASWLLLAVAFVAALAVLYRHGPDRDEPKWRWVTPGALAALVGWIAISIAFRLYVANFGSYDETYGSLAAIVVVLFWLYLSALVIIAGAQLNAELEHQTARDSTKGPDRPLGARDAEMADTIGRRTG
ncbi:MAG TPA: YihY/virulence factor BrkB family protein [Microthrixaceae bacterium]|nr:YihY/virulence factor BrkB family protein [Microthrixaceae bacterium]